jgi:hypothetical protein
MERNVGSMNGTKPETGTRGRKRGKFLARVFFWLGALAVSTGLALIAYFVSWEASLSALTAIAMLALVQVSRRARDREAIAGLVAAAARTARRLWRVLFGIGSVT